MNDKRVRFRCLYHQHWLNCSAIVLIISIFISCSRTATPPDERTKQLKLIAEYNLSVAEPSGISLAEDHNSLWLVSDQTGKIQRISLTGQILETLAFDGKDLEGIYFDANRNQFWVVSESERGIFQLSRDGTVLQHKTLAFGSVSNNGFEGITLDENDAVMIVNEKNPVRLLRLDEQLNISQIFDPAVSSDFSDICRDTLGGRFWLLSDEDRQLILWDQTEGLLEQYPLPLTKPEGVAIDFEAQTVYVVSDDAAKLYIFRFTQL